MQNIFRSTALAVICSMLAVGAGGNVVDYSMADSDFSSMTGIPDTYTVTGLEIWATRDGSSVVFPAGNYTDWDKSANSGVAPYVQNVLRLEAGSSVSRTLDVDGAVDNAPHAGDI